MKSVWEETTRFKSNTSLDKNINTDVLIIGGGMCGLLCAYMLKQAGIDYVLVESDIICSGVTKNTTAKITSQHGLIYHKLINKFGTEKAKQYLYANETALNQYSMMCKNIDCDFEYKDSYVYSIDSRDKIFQELSALNKLGYGAEFCDSLPLPISVAGAVKFKNQAQFNPLKFASEISKNLNIYIQQIQTDFMLPQDLISGV